MSDLVKCPRCRSLELAERYGFVRGWHCVLCDGVQKVEASLSVAYILYFKDIEPLLITSGDIALFKRKFWGGANE